MRGTSWVVLMSLAAAVCQAADPAVANVRAAQRPGTGLVDITYDLADEDTAMLSVSLSVSTNGGAAFFTPASGLSGDMGSVAPGTGRSAVWDAESTLPPRLFNNMRVQIIASDEPTAPPSTPTMVLIPGGTFTMGELLDVAAGEQVQDHPPHSVTVNSFSMDACEVTYELWCEFAFWAADNSYDLRGYYYLPAWDKPFTFPITGVSWHNAVKWCNARSEKEGLTPCYRVGGGVYRAGTSDDVVCDWSANGYRLPTEAEWEYAARGGLSGLRFPWGDTISHSLANYSSSSFFSWDISPTRGYHPVFSTGVLPYVYPYTSPPGSFAPNGYGLYDMSGNVEEWTWDWYGAAYYNSSPAENPTGPQTGTYRVYRGGGWALGPMSCRAFGRMRSSPDSNGGGFRAVRRAP